MSTAPFDPDGLWLKARLFLNRAMDGTREFEESAFWASCALELLGKAALSRVSPLLIANPIDDGKSMLIASGLQPDAGGFQTVQAKTIYARCEKAFRPFSHPEAKKLSESRNEYIHSAGVGFDAIPEHAWWPRYWAQAVILVSHLDRDIEDLVGTSRARTVEGHLAKSKEMGKQRLEALIQKAVTRLNQSRTGTLSARLSADWSRFRLPSLSYWTPATCPACGEQGRVEGEEKLEVQYDYPRGGYVEEEGYISPDVRVLVATDLFACPTCHLVVNDWEVLSASELPTEFETEGDESDIEVEEEYMNE